MIMSDTHLAMLSPLKNRPMSWSEDCHGNPLALITVLSHTFSVLLLLTHKHTHISTEETRHALMTLILSKLLTKYRTQTSRLLAPD